MVSCENCGLYQAKMMLMFGYLLLIPTDVWLSDHLRPVTCFLLQWSPHHEGLTCEQFRVWQQQNQPDQHTSTLLSYNSIGTNMTPRPYRPGLGFFKLLSVQYHNVILCMETPVLVTVIVLCENDLLNPSWTWPMCVSVFHWAESSQSLSVSV